MTDYSDLIARLESKVHNGHWTMGTVSLLSDGTSTSTGGEKIFALKNPDGAAAVAAIRRLEAEVFVLKAKLERERSFMEHDADCTATESMNDQHGGAIRQPCDCGLDGFLAELDGEALGICISPQDIPS